MILTREEMLQAVCEGLQTDECIAHCNHPYCYQCTKVVDNLLQAEKDKLPQPEHKTVKYENKDLEYIQNTCSKYQECDQCPHNTPGCYCNIYNSDRCESEILTVWAAKMREVEEKLNESTD